MDAVDGALVRFRPPSARLAGAQLADLAAISRRYADGHVLLTRRAKVELRGVADTDTVRRALRDAGLFIPRDPGVPDCVMSPADDRDPEALADARPVARSIATAFEQDDSVPGAALPDKFLFVVNGNGQAHTAEVYADVRFDAQPESGDDWRVSLAGDAADSVCLGRAKHRDLPAVARSLASAFKTMRSARGTEIRRLQHALDACGRAPFDAAVEPWVCPVSVAPPSVVKAAATPTRLGQHAGTWYGLGWAFGRIPAEALEALADSHSTVPGEAADIRLTPDRRLLIVADPESLPLATLRSVGAIDDASDPRLRIAACIGRRGCRQATTDTRADAQILADAVPTLDDTAGGIALHVSGCAKGCAHTRTSPITLVGRDGAYDLVLAGAADAPPLIRGLGTDAARRALAAVGRFVERQRRPDESPVSVLGRLSRRTLYDFLKVETADV